jgi:hypothetical protein
MNMSKLAALGVGITMLPSFAHAALLYLDPGQAEYGLGDTFLVHVRLDNEGECVNAVRAVVEYPTDKLRAVDFSRGRSIVSLWVEEPTLDTERGIVTFSGGIPGGYCGRIQGDPALSNVVGTIVFTAVDGDGNARATISSGSEVYISDGEGTKAALSLQGASFSLAPYPTLPDNEWLKAVGEDTIPPDPFEVIVESTWGVFGGKYYIVFSTVDKQSGLDHFEIFERGVWKRVTSPHVVEDQLLRNDVEVRAIDKAGNERLGDYTPGSAPPRKAPTFNLFFVSVLIVALVALGGIWFFMHRNKGETGPPSA